MKKNPLAVPAWASRGQQQVLDRLAARGRAWAWISATGEVHGAKTQQSAAKAARVWESRVARASRGPAPYTRVIDLGSEPLPTRANSRRSYKRKAERTGAAVKRAEIAAARMALEASDFRSDAWSARGRSVGKLRFQHEVADRRAARGKIRKQAKKWVSNPAAKVKVSVKQEVNAYGLRLFHARVDFTAKNLGVWERVFSSQEAADTAVRRLKALAQKATRASGLSYFDPTASGWRRLREKENPYRGPLTIAHEGPDLVIRHHEIVNPYGKFAHESVPGRTITKRDFSAYFQPGDLISIRAASGYGDEGEYGIWQWNGRDLLAVNVVRVPPGTSWWKAYPPSVRPIRARLTGGTFTLSATQRR